MTIGEASEKTGLSADTLRYYEKIGLIPPVPRRENGLRDYGAETIKLVALIQRLTARALREHSDARDGARRERLGRAGDAHGRGGVAQNHARKSGTSHSPTSGGQPLSPQTKRKSGELSRIS